jgi:SAM-dependent methyltransferase
MRINVSNIFDWSEQACMSIETQPQALWRRHSDSVYRNLLRHWLPASLNCVLKTDAFDEAVSAGVYHELARHSPVIITIDISPSILTRARERYPSLLCVCTDVRRLPFRSGSFDAVVSLSTLDHFDVSSDIAISIEESVRVMRQGGTFILTLDNLDNPIIALRAIMPYRLLHALKIVPYQVGTTCSSRRLQRIISRTHLHMVEMTFILHCPRVFAVALARLLEIAANVRLHQAFLVMLSRMEHLCTWPTRFVTGYYIAVHTRKQSVADPCMISIPNKKTE